MKKMKGFSFSNSQMNEKDKKKSKRWKILSCFATDNKSMRKGAREVALVLMSAYIDDDF